MEQPTDRPYGVWLALDGIRFTRAQSIMKTTEALVDGFKVHTLVMNSLERRIRAMRKYNAGIWLDCKWHDIPETVGEYARIAKELGIDRISVHASGGIEMMQAAVEQGPEEVAAITTLTSLSRTDVELLGGKSLAASVRMQTSWALLAGVTHIVCPADQTGAVHDLCTTHCKKASPHMRTCPDVVVPGTRTLRTSPSSHKHVTSAADALRAGAEELVLGREVLGSTRPSRQIEKIYRAIWEDLDEGEEDNLEIPEDVVG